MLSLTPYRDRAVERKARCRLWTGTDRTVYLLNAQTVDTLITEVKEAYSLSEDVDFILYFIPNGRDVSTRRIVTINADLDAFFRLADAPTMYVWDPGDPRLSPASLPSPSVTSTSGSNISSSASPNSTRGQMQKKFRDAVRKRDGFKCVLSGVELRDKTGNLEAAHILGVEAKLKRDRDSARVFNEYDTTNGMLLEKSLYLAFDSYRWCLDENGKVHVHEPEAEANKDIAKWNGEFADLKIGDPGYPYKSLLKVRFSKFQERRHL